MFRVGVTGGIGSGKTLVCRIFEILSVPVYYADFHAKRLMESDSGIREELSKLFGPSVVSEGRINKEKIAQIVFNDHNALRSINGIIHPAVRKDFDAWVKKKMIANMLLKKQPYFLNRVLTNYLISP